MVEKETFGKLGDYVTLEKRAEPNLNWLVLQVKTAKYPLATCLRSEKFKKMTLKALETAQKYIKFLELDDVVFVTADKLQKTVFKDLKGNGTIKTLKHYGKGTLGSNAYIENTIEVIGGILFKNPLFYLKPPYVNGNIQTLLENNLNGKRTDKNGLFLGKIEYLIDRVISEDEVINNTKQQMRIFREKEKKKLVIVISNIKLSENGYIPEIGAIVKKIDEKEIEREIFEFFKDEFEEKVAERIKRKLNGKLKLDEIAKELASYGIYGKTWFKNLIKSKKFQNKYDLEVVKEKNVFYITR